MNNLQFSLQREAIEQKFISTNKDRVSRVTRLVERVICESAEQIGIDGEISIGWRGEDRFPVIEFQCLDGLARKKTNLLDTLNPHLHINGKRREPDEDSKNFRLLTKLSRCLSDFLKEERENGR
jgi:hypothetical protein